MMMIRMTVIFFWWWRYGCALLYIFLLILALQLFSLVMAMLFFMGIYFFLFYHWLLFDYVFDIESNTMMIRMTVPSPFCSCIFHAKEDGDNQNIIWSYVYHMKEDDFILLFFSFDIMFCWCLMIYHHSKEVN